MMTIEARLLALEKQAIKNKPYLFPVLCKGSEPTPEEEAYADEFGQGYRQIMFITFYSGCVEDTHTD